MIAQVAIDAYRLARAARNSGGCRQCRPSPANFLKAEQVDSFSLTVIVLYLDEALVEWYLTGADVGGGLGGAFRWCRERPAQSEGQGVEERHRATRPKLRRVLTGD